MLRPRTPKLSWLFTILCIGYFSTYGMYSVNDTQTNRTYDLKSLRRAFPAILETQPKFIYLDSTESQYNNTKGIYKLLPYYQKVSTEQLNPQDSRFIIHKHVMTGQWQLTEVYDYFWTRSIKAFPVTEENEENALLNNQFIKSLTIHELEKTISNASMEITSKNSTIESLTNENKLLISFMSKQRRKLANQEKIEKELKSKLIEKENEIHNIYKTQIELELKLIEKENKIRDIYNSHEELKSKLIENENKMDNLLQSKLMEKENEIDHQFNKSESKLIEKENQIRDLQSKIEKYKTLKCEQNETHQQNIKLIHIQHRSKILNLRNKHLEEIEKSKEELKLLEKENRISNQELSKYQKSNKKLESENVAFKKKDTLLEEMINQLSKKIKIFEEKLSTNGCIKLRQLQHQEPKENLDQNESQIEQNTGKSENGSLETRSTTSSLEHGVQNFDTRHESKQSLENENVNVETKTQKKLQMCESTIKRNYGSSKLEKHENKTSLKNEITLQKHQESVKLEEHKSKEEKRMKKKIDKKQNKILNTIENILLESMPCSNREKSMVYNRLIEMRQRDYKTLVFQFLQKLQCKENENMILKIKSCLENKNALMANTNPNYQYESMLMHIGVVGYAKYTMKNSTSNEDNYTQYMINNLGPIDDSCIDDYVIEHKHFVAGLKTIYVKHDKILDDMLKSVKDEKMKTKIKCFRNSECLFSSPNYRYESFLRTIGIIMYSCGNNLEEKYIELEKQILKNENISQESAKSENHEKEHNLKNETNVETDFLKDSPMKLSEGLMKVKQLAKEVKETLHQGELQITNNEEACQLRGKIVINKSISEEQKNENILKKNKEKNSLKITTKETLSKIENNKKILKKSISSKRVETNDTFSKEEKSSAKKMKKKIAMKQKPMLNVIEEILLESMPSPKNGSTIKEIMAQKKGNDYKSLVFEFVQSLADQEDPQLILDIKSFLENKHSLNKDPNYQYELMLMHVGAMYYNHDMQKVLENVVNSTDFSNLFEDDQEKLKNCVAELSELYKKHETIFADMLKSTKDEKIKIRIKYFKEQECLYDLPQYRYEHFIRTIGMIVYGRGNALEEI